MTASDKIIGSSDDFEAFINSYDNSEFRNEVCNRFNKSKKDTNDALDIYFSEMRFGYRFLQEHIPTGKLRILEVGAGLGLLSIYLKRLGHDAVALEPSGLDYDLFGITKSLIWTENGNKLPVLLNKIAEEIDAKKDGEFDFIFSINVMEHIQDIEKASFKILSVLKPGGICVNSCPNYIVPYEPHYAIPMVPFLPSVTRKLFARQIDRNPDTWDTLNFINWFTVRRVARNNNSTVSFEKALIYKSFMRLADDPEFMSRHQGGPIGKIYKFLATTRLLYLLKLLPPVFSTPMVFTYRHKNQL